VGASLSYPQYVFMNQLDTRYQAFIGGLGSGKTFAGCNKLFAHHADFPKTTTAYYAPTYGLIRDIFYPTMEEAAYYLGFTAIPRVGNREVEIYRGKKFYGIVKCRSMEKPESIIGFKTSMALADEIDILSIEKATSVFRRINERNRIKLPDGTQNRVSFTGSPEGFKFLFNRFGDSPKKDFSMVQCSTYENSEYLPDDYIESLLTEYPKEMVDAYLLGQFVNLTSGTVLYAFDRRLHDTNVTAQKNEEIRIGMDFNVQKMAACVYVVREGVWHQVDEFMNIFDTPAMIATICGKYTDRAITVYPDASGGSRKSVSASETDISLLRQANFQIKVKNSNPRVQERIIASNRAYQQNKIRVNCVKCPQTVKSIEQLAYNKFGEPDKDNDLDHPFDAHTYPIAYEFPIRRPVAPINVRFSS
jgi:hypothetical protein